MLIPIAESGLTDPEKIAAVAFREWVAIDMQTGAYLSRPYGRGKGGLPKFVLILPVKTIEERGGVFASTGEWVRSIVRAWSSTEALTVANERLPKLMKRRASARARLIGEAQPGS